MPALDPRIIQNLSEVAARGVVMARGVPGHQIVEAFLVREYFLTSFG